MERHGAGRRGVPRRPLRRFGSRRGGWAQVKGQRLLGLAAFQRVWLRLLGQRKRRRAVLFRAGSVAAAGAGAAQEELDFTAMLA